MSLRNFPEEPLSETASDRVRQWLPERNGYSHPHSMTGQQLSKGVAKGQIFQYIPDFSAHFHHTGVRGTGGCAPSVYGGGRIRLVINGVNCSSITR